MTDPRTPTSDPVAAARKRLTDGRVKTDHLSVPSIIETYADRLLDLHYDDDDRASIVEERDDLLAWYAVFEAEARQQARAAFADMRSILSIARGRVDAGIDGRGDAVVWQRLAEDLDAALALLAASPEPASPEAPGSGLREAAQAVVEWADAHEPWNPLGEFAVLKAALAAARPDGAEADAS